MNTSNISLAIWVFLALLVFIPFLYHSMIGGPWGSALFIVVAVSLLVGGLDFIGGSDEGQ